MEQDFDTMVRNLKQFMKEFMTEHSDRLKEYCRNGGKDKYGIYTYYRGSNEYDNRKAAYYSMFEADFEMNYHGNPENRVEAFKEHICDALYERISDASMFGLSGVDKIAALKEGLKTYMYPDFRMEYWV